jgi:hypothetical protein
MQSTHLCFFAARARAPGIVVSCSLVLALGPTTARAAEPQSDSVQQPQSERARKLLIAGGVLGGIGLVATSIGFGVLGGIHMGNPGIGKSLEFDDPAQGRHLVRTANTMEVVGSLGASVLLTGVILAVVGGVKLRRARATRVSAAIGPRSVGLVVRF